MHEPLLRSTLEIPTAPFHEQRVAQHVRDIASARGLKAMTDSTGNVVVRCKRGAGAKPLAFVAHMDHPGFEVESVRRDRATLLALGDTRGRKAVGAELIAQTEHGEVPGVLTAIRERESGTDRNKRVLAEFRGPVAVGDFAHWAFPGYRRRGKRIWSRAIDDVAGVAALLAAIEVLVEGEAPCDLYACFTRAEEVGFVGATALASGKVLSKSVPVVSIEMSKALPGAEQGKGYVVRLGDRLTLFDPSLTQFLMDTARWLESDSSVPFQSRLMDGGACEATAFNALGFAASGVCLPLGNYHNQGTDGLAPEFIHADDWQGLVRFIVAACERSNAYQRKQGDVKERVFDFYQRYRNRLLVGIETALAPDRLPVR